MPQKSYQCDPKPGCVGYDRNDRARRDEVPDDLPLFQPSAKIGLTPEIVKAVEVYLDEKTNKILRASPIVRSARTHSLFKGDKS